MLHDDGGLTTMKRILTTTLLSLTLLLPLGASFAQSAAEKQKDKNLMRNLGVGLGAAAADKAIKGKHKDALILGAAAALAGKKYEDQRKSQKEWRSYQTKRGKKVGYWVMRGNTKVRYVALKK